tara:strand:+ start:10833 stop:10946 length:114 start_codon:yes stop_codon:yes gene_type:complete
MIGPLILRSSLRYPAFHLYYGLYARPLLRFGDVVTAL